MEVVVEVTSVMTTLESTQPKPQNAGGWTGQQFGGSKLLKLAVCLGSFSLNVWCFRLVLGVFGQQVRLSLACLVAPSFTKRALGSFRH